MIRVGDRNEISNDDVKIFDVKYFRDIVNNDDSVN